MGGGQSVAIHTRLNPATLAASPLCLAVTAVAHSERHPKAVDTGLRFAAHLIQGADGGVKTVVHD